MKVIRKCPGEEPELIEIENDLKALQDEVGGYIETVTDSDSFVVICNEEGRLLGLPENCNVVGRPYVGTILIAGIDVDEFDDVPNVVLKNLDNTMIIQPFKDGGIWG